MRHDANNNADECDRASSSPTDDAKAKKSSVGLRANPNEQADYRCEEDCDEPFHIVMRITPPSSGG